jgi:3-oxoacyl-[acyl-carrier protein] reductase
MGAAIARRLANDGFAVVLTFHSRESEAAGVVADIKAAGGRAIALQIDLATDSLDGLFQIVDTIFNRLDVVVLSAGVSHLGSVTSVSEDLFEQIFATNTRSAFRAFRHAAERLEAGGRVVVISTDLVRNPISASAVYSGSKAALEAIAKSFADELGPRGITVNIVAPGITETESLVLPQEVIADIVERTPLRRVGKPEDIADVVAFLASPAARWLTGQTITANGGLL